MKMKMNPGIKQRWIDKLRDKSITQGKAALHDAQGAMCCLGVLCSIAVEDEVIERPHLSGHRGSFYRYGYPDDSSTNYLPRYIAQWAGLESENPIVEVHDDAYKSLADLNDTGATFEEIADLIERSL